MNTKKAIRTSIGMLCLLQLYFCGTHWLQTYREYAHICHKNELLIRQKEALRQALNAQEHYRNKLINDPEFFHHVMRKRLGYTQPGEVVFKFQNS